MSAARVSSRKIIYGPILISLDGFINGPNRELDWHVVDEDLHTFIDEQLREVDTFLFGRRMYETMAVWDTLGSDPEAPEFEREFARSWDTKLKIVFSSTLDSVQGNARLADTDIAEEIATLKSRPGLDAEIGGASLASAAIRHGLVDEFRFFVQPIILGTGTPVFQSLDNSIGLKLIETHAFRSGVVYLRYSRADEDHNTVSTGIVNEN